VSSGGFGGLAMGGVPIPVVLAVSRVDEVFDEPGSLRDPKRAARVRPFIDGSVHFVKNLIDSGTWAAVGTRAGGEVILNPF
jgi:hypothetical protein